jgi:hypothetical protein
MSNNVQYIQSTVTGIIPNTTGIGLGMTPQQPVQIYIATTSTLSEVLVSGYLNHYVQNIGDVALNNYQMALVETTDEGPVWLKVVATPQANTSPNYTLEYPSSGSGGSGITTIDGNSGSVTGSTITINGGSTGLTTSSAGTTLSLGGTLGTGYGGTGLSTTTDSAILYTSSGGVPAWTAAMTNGQLLIGSTGADPVLTTLTEGDNITITNAAGSITIAASGGGGGPTYVNQTTDAATLAPNTVYINNNTSGVTTFSLPVSAAVGDTYTIVGTATGTGGWTIPTPTFGQTINFGLLSTVDTSDALSSTHPTDSVTLTCVTANSTWTAYNAQGNLALTEGSTNSCNTTSLQGVNGALLIGDTSNQGIPVAATLTAGTGISITEGAGTITIAVSA